MQATCLPGRLPRPGRRCGEGAASGFRAFCPSLPAGPGSSRIARLPLALGTFSGPGCPVLFGNWLLQTREAPGAGGWGCCLAAGDRQGWASPGCRPAGCLAPRLFLLTCCRAADSSLPWGRGTARAHLHSGDQRLPVPAGATWVGAGRPGCRASPPRWPWQQRAPQHQADGHCWGTSAPRRITLGGPSPGADSVLSRTRGRRDTGSLLHLGLQDSLAPPSPILGSLPPPMVLPNPNLSSLLSLNAP